MAAGMIELAGDYLGMQNVDASADTSDVLDRFARGKASILDVLSLVESAERCGFEMIQVTVFRKRKPERDKPIRMLGKSGPHSFADKPVVQAAKHMCAGWWRVADVRLWLTAHSRELDAARANLARNS
jgi:hypothetical protein